MVDNDTKPTKANARSEVAYLQSLAVLARIEHDIAAVLRHVEDTLKSIANGCVSEEPESARLAMTTLASVERGLLDEIEKLNKKRPNRLSVYADNAQLARDNHNTQMVLQAVDTMLEKLSE